MRKCAVNVVDKFVLIIRKSQQQTFADTWKKVIMTIFGNDYLNYF